MRSQLKRSKQKNFIDVENSFQILLLFANYHIFPFGYGTGRMFFVMLLQPIIIILYKFSSFISIFLLATLFDIFDI